jgi:hypothetical protein
MMNVLTEKDRGTFLVTTQGSTHIWEITDEHVFVTRNPGRESHWSMGDFPNGRRNVATKVVAWPEVGGAFMYYLHGDTPWTRSSLIKSIERVDTPQPVV